MADCGTIQFFSESTLDGLYEIETPFCFSINRNHWSTEADEALTNKTSSTNFLSELWIELPVFSMLISSVFQPFVKDSDQTLLILRKTNRNNTTCIGFCIMPVIPFIYKVYNVFPVQSPHIYNRTEKLILLQSRLHHPSLSYL